MECATDDEVKKLPSTWFQAVKCGGGGGPSAGLRQASMSWMLGEAAPGSSSVMEAIVEAAAMGWSREL